MTPAARLLVLAKEPLPGRVKTRLVPDFSPAEAARLALAALADTLDTVRAAATLLTGTGMQIEPWLVFDGDPWLDHAGFTVVPQTSGALDERLAGAFAAAAEPTTGTGPVPAVLVGMDTPQASQDVLAAAVACVVSPAGPDACIGLAADGGWWLLGLRRPDPALLSGLPMSTPRTGAETCRRLVEAGLTVESLPVLRDVDTAADAALVAGQAPGSRFAAVHDELQRWAS